MPNYNEYNCPVCNRQFEDGDDIVTCPECGTPHHRDCYNLTGHCVNKGLHATDYSFLDEEKKAADGEQDIVKQALSERVLSVLNNDDDENEEAQKPISRIVVMDKDGSKYGDDKIGDYQTADIAATIRVNADRFIKIFKKQNSSKKKLGWNWGAFFFDSLYMFYRKMYKQGLAFLSIIVSIFFVSSTLIVKLAPNYLAAMNDFISANIAGEFASQEAAIKAINATMSVADASTARTIIYCTYLAFLVVRIIASLYADHYYKNTVIGIIDKVGELLDKGASFTPPHSYLPQGAELSQAQMKRMYLANKGGVTLFAPMLAVSAVYFLLGFIG